MLNLKVADLFADLTLRTAKFDATMRKVKSSLQGLKSPVLAVSVSTNRINAAMAMINQLRASARAPIQVRFAVAPGAPGGVPAIYAWKKALARGVTIPIGANTKPFFKAVRLIDKWFVGMGRRSTITMDLNTRRADAKARALLRQIQQLKAQAKSVRVGMAGGLRGGRGGGSPGGIGGGLMQGLGMPLYGSPQMIAGEFAGRGLAASVATAANFEETMIRIGQAAKISGPELERLKNDLLALGAAKPGASSGELLDIALTGAKQGVEGADNLRRFAADIAQVRNAIGKDVPIEEMTDHMSRLLHTFDLGTEHVRGLGSALVALDNMTTASARDILDISQRASGPAHVLGYTPEQTMGLAATLRNRGLTPETAGTALSQIMTKMATEIDDFSAALGMPTEELRKLLQADPMKAFAAVLKKLHDMPSAVDALGLTESLGLKGVRVKGGLLQLAGDVDNIAPRVAAAARERATGQSLDRMDSAISGATASKWQTLANEATALAEAFGSRLKPATDGLADALKLGIGVVGPVLKEFAGALSFFIAAFDKEAFLRKASPETPDPARDPNLNTDVGANADVAMAAAWKAEGVKAGKFYAGKLTEAAKGWWKPFRDSIDYEKAARAARLRSTIQGIAQVPGNAARMQAGLFRIQAMPALDAVWRGMAGNAEVMRDRAKGARLQVHASGLDFGRRLQEDILNSKNDEDQKKIAQNTAEINAGIKSLVGIAQRSAQAAGPARAVAGLLGL